jgi:uncharacterized protein (TIGR00255 family)
MNKAFQKIDAQATSLRIKEKVIPRRDVLKYLFPSILVGMPTFIKIFLSMLLSMTGFGRQEFQTPNYSGVIEIRSLNGKQFEINTKLSPLLKPYEIDVRNLVQAQLIRGSVDVNILIKQHGNARAMTVNTELAKHYYQAMMQIADELQLEKKDILSTLMRMPEIVSASSDVLDVADWEEVGMAVQQACEALMAQRRQEGVMLTKHIRHNIETIARLANEVDPLEKSRIPRLRDKLLQAVQEHSNGLPADANRLEQEIIFYVEKLDINEERNRLRHHCLYFNELIAEEGLHKGKKLGFLLQEIGREINTLGSKANDVGIQKLVVAMKDELEQAKEQLLNAL